MTPELLSPARDLPTAIDAILSGADSVYIGAPEFGARKSAANSVEDIKKLCEFAHLYGCKVYAALNTILYDAELPRAAKIAEELWDAGVDAIIAQDLGLLRVASRRIKFHASTQCHADSADKAGFLEAAGFAAVVLARETPLEGISAAAGAIGVPIECFVHGALCVSYSGQCYLSYKIGGRSGNRGECAQPCRMLYEFIDANGAEIAPPRHYLSLRDMNRISALSEMIDAGARILKIEGRLKDSGYVKNATAAYRAALYEQLKKRGLPRASYGESRAVFSPDLQKTFNRRFCLYHLRGIERGCGSFSTPKAIGEFLGEAEAVFPGGFKMKNAEKIFSNGDGLFFETGLGGGFGAGVSAVEGDTVKIGRPGEKLCIPPRAKIWRNRDVKFERALAGKISRKMPVRISVSDAGEFYLFSILTSDNRGISFSLKERKSDFEESKNFLSEKNKFLQALSRLGDTPFECPEPKIECQTLPHMPVSKIGELRRGLADGLKMRILEEYEKQRLSYERPLPRKIKFSKPPFETDARANIANREAEKMYADMGFKISARAPEAGGDISKIPLMRTRHCVLRELGMCRKEVKLDRRFSEPFFLKSRDGKFPLRFDCANCQMFVLNPDS